jgi:hypothetical protein
VAAADLLSETARSVSRTLFCSLTGPPQ